MFVVGYAIGVSHNFQATYSAVPDVEVVSIYDGDTITVNLEGWPDIIGHRIGIRVSGIDTPELRDNRESVKALAREAKQFVVAKLRDAKRVELRNLERDKYFRIVADVYVDGENLSEMLLDVKLAQKYDGGKKPKWK